MRSPLTLLTDAFAQFRTQPKLYAGIYIIPAFLTFMGSIFYSGAFNVDQPIAMLSMGELLIASIVGLVLFVTSILMAIAMLKAVMEPTNTITSAYQYALSICVRYTVLAILLSVIMFVGFLLFIIPGIIFMVWFAFSYYVLIREDTSVFGALRRSKELTKGRWWPVFFRLVMLGMFSLIAALIVGGVSFVFGLIDETILPGLVNLAFNLVLIPVSLMYMNNLYDDVRHTTSTEHPAVGAQQDVNPMDQHDDGQQSTVPVKDAGQEHDGESTTVSPRERDSDRGM